MSRQSSAGINRGLAHAKQRASLIETLEARIAELEADVARRIDAAAKADAEVARLNVLCDRLAAAGHS
ncbi:MAG: hypothetical protein WCP98_04275 [Actinomycetes bacterium]